MLPVVIIACRVLESLIEDLLHDTQSRTIYMDYGLHRLPQRMPAILQAELDALEDTLAVDVIAEVGPSGHFLGERHTFRHFREFWRPELIDRAKVDDWEAAGSKTLGDRVHEKVINLIETYEPEPIPDDVETRLKEIIAQAKLDAVIATIRKSRTAERALNNLIIGT